MLNETKQLIDTKIGDLENLLWDIKSKLIAEAAQHSDALSLDSEWDTMANDALIMRCMVQILQLVKHISVEFLRYDIWRTADVILVWSTLCKCSRKLKIYLTIETTENVNRTYATNGNSFIIIAETVIADVLELIDALFDHSQYKGSTEIEQQEEKELHTEKQIGLTRSINGIHVLLQKLGTLSKQKVMLSQRNGVLLRIIKQLKRDANYAEFKCQRMEVCKDLELAAQKLQFLKSETESKLRLEQEQMQSRKLQDSVVELQNALQLRNAEVLERNEKIQKLKQQALVLEDRYMGKDQEFEYVLNELCQKDKELKMRQKFVNDKECQTVADEQMPYNLKLQKSLAELEKNLQANREQLSAEQERSKKMEIHAERTHSALRALQTAVAKIKSEFLEFRADGVEWAEQKTKQLRNERATNKHLEQKLAEMRVTSLQQERQLAKKEEQCNLNQQHFTEMEVTLNIIFKEIEDASSQIMQFQNSVKSLKNHSILDRKTLKNQSSQINIFPKLSTKMLSPTSFDIKPGINRCKSIPQLHKRCSATSTAEPNPRSRNVLLDALGKTFGNRRLELLKWCKLKTLPYGIPMYEFHNSWRSGNALCAILHSFKPDLIDEKYLKCEDAAETLTYGVTMAQLLGVKSTCDFAKECQEKRPNYKKIFQFVEQVYFCLEINL